MKPSDERSDTDWMGGNGRDNLRSRARRFFLTISRFDAIGLVAGILTISGFSILAVFDQRTLANVGAAMGLPVACALLAWVIISGKIRSRRRDEVRAMTALNH